MKVIAMIPARLGSQRVSRKNLRLIDGKPLISYIVEAAKQSNVFDEIYINSEAEIFGEIASIMGVKFYKRDPRLASNASINDEFAIDFINNTDGDILIQLLPTSPLITSDEISKFVKEMLRSKWDTLVSVNNHQIACIFNGRPINFGVMEPHRSSQEMIPVQSYATVLMGWTYETFKHNMRKFGFAYHGADGKTGYFPISGLSTIDIDNEEDFRLAEVALSYRQNKSFNNPQYFEGDKSNLRSESNVQEILKKDGVIASDFSQENQPISSLKEIIKLKDMSQSWSHRIINTENNSATLISQLPGEGNRLHYHPDWNEWWYIVDGEWQWLIDQKTVVVKKGEIVFIEKGKWHKITAIGDKPAIRLAVSKDKVPHIYK